MDIEEHILLYIDKKVQSKHNAESSYPSAQGKQ